LLRKVIRRAKEIYYNEMLTASTNKSKVSWKIINNETGHAPKKKFMQPELRNGNEKIDINKAAKSINTYFISSMDKLINQHPKNEGAQLSLREGFPDKFPEIVNIPITAAEVLSSILSLKVRLLVDMMGCLTKLSNYVVNR
jgi:hypothetical protein